MAGVDAAMATDASMKTDAAMSTAPNSAPLKHKHTPIFAPTTTRNSHREEQALALPCMHAPLYAQAILLTWPYDCASYAVAVRAVPAP